MVRHKHAVLTAIRAAECVGIPIHDTHGHGGQGGWYAGRRRPRIGTDAVFIARTLRDVRLQSAAHQNVQVVVDRGAGALGASRTEYRSGLYTFSA